MGRSPKSRVPNRPTAVEFIYCYSCGKIKEVLKRRADVGDYGSCSNCGASNCGR